MSELSLAFVRRLNALQHWGGVLPKGVPPRSAEGGPAETRSLPKRALRRMLIVGIRFVQAHEGVRRLALWLLGRMPHLQRRFVAFATYNARFIHSSGTAIYPELGPGFAKAELSPETCVIYSRMRRMIPKPQNPPSR